MGRTHAPLVILSTLLVTVFSVLPLRAASPAHFWSKGFGSTTADLGTSVAVDASGSIIVTGTFTGTVSFGGASLVSAGDTDIFLAKYDANGVHQWSQRFGSTGADASSATAVDASGNVVVVGLFAGTVDFGGGPLVGQGTTDVFVAKYNASGVHQWSKRLGSTVFEVCEGVAIDASSNVIVAGQFAGTVDFGGGGLVATFSDMFLVKYNSAGTHLWSMRFPDNIRPHDVALEASGNIVVVGLFAGTASLGGTALVSAGGLDIFLAKYNASGVHQWSKGLGGTGHDTGYGVAVDSYNSSVITGIFNSTVDFGGGPLVDAGNGDIFLAKYDFSGAHTWSKRFGSASSDQGSAVTVDASDTIVLTGYFQGTADFGGGNLVPAGSTDIVVAKYDPTGGHEWSQRYGGTTFDQGNAVKTDASRNVIVTGGFRVTADFGGGSLVSAGNYDVFLVKFGPAAAEPRIVSVTDVGNDQGRQVRLFFARSGHDLAQSPTGVTRYDLYRRLDTLPVASPTPVPTPPLEQWDYVGTVPAYRAAGYNAVVPTLADSTIANGMHYSRFFVRAGTDDPGVFFDSALDSGYSVDNLAPSVPLGLVYNAGVLNWNDSNAADFDYFTVYGASTASFGSAIVIDYATASTLDVSASPYTFYFVTATDFSGNEGKPAVINTLSGVGETPVSYVLSVTSYPNPFNPTTTVKYTVPSRGRVTVVIYDAVGSRVRALVDGEREAGPYTAVWDGRDDRGRGASSGVYFARVSHAGKTKSYKMVLLK